MLDAAQKQHGAELYRRAVDIALQARSGESALTAAQAWDKDLPDSTEADRFVLQILLALNRPDETGPVLSSLLKRSQGSSRLTPSTPFPRPSPAWSTKPWPCRWSAKPGTLAQTTRSGSRRLDHHWPPGTGRGSKLPGIGLGPQRPGQADPASVFPALLALELMEQGQIGAEAIVRGQLAASPPTSEQRHNRSAQLRPHPAGPPAQRRSPRPAENAHPQPSLTFAEPWLLLATLEVQDNTLPAANQSLETYMRLARDSGDERQRTRPDPGLPADVPDC